MANWLEMNPSTLVLARGELASLPAQGRGVPHLLRYGQAMGNRKRTSGGLRARPWGGGDFHGTNQDRRRGSSDGDSAPRDPRGGAREGTCAVPLGRLAAALHP